MQSETNSRRVVVTGIGIVSPIGNGVQAFWEGLVAGKNGVSTVTRFNPEGLTCTVAAEVNDLDMDQYMDPKEQKLNDR